MQNIDNYSNVIYTREEVNNDTIANIVNITQSTITNGCNQYIKNIDHKNLLVIIPNKYIKQVCDRSKKTFDEIMDEFRSMGFKYEVYNLEEGKYFSFLKGSSFGPANYTIINCPLDGYDKHIRYYAFCMIRHFYYYEDYLVRYLELINKDTPESLKIQILSYLNLLYNPSNTFIYYGIFKETSFKEIFTKYDKAKTNSNAEFGLDYIQGNLGLTGRNTLEGILEDLKVYNKLNNLVSNWLFSESLIPELNTYLIDPVTIVPGLKITSGGNGRKLYAYSIKDLNLSYIDNIPSTSTYIYIGVKGNAYLASSKGNNGHTLIRLNTDKYTKHVNTMLLSKKKDITVSIRSRHPSHKVFRNTLVSKFKTLIRLGSTTVSSVKWDIELNKIAAIQNSSNKLLMKQCFTKAGVKTPNWYTIVGNLALRSGTETGVALDTLQFPIVAKHVLGSRNSGNYKIDNVNDLVAFTNRRRAELTSFIFEEFANYAKEYRIHVSTEGTFLMWRKLRRKDTPDNQKWFFNNENCNWAGVDNELFDTPTSIKAMQAECLKALNSVTLDFGAVDIRVMSNTNKDGNRRENVDFSIIEINSAPSMAERTSEAYIEEFMKLIQKRSVALV